MASVTGQGSSSTGYPWSRFNFIPPIFVSHQSDLWVFQCWTISYDGGFECKPPLIYSQKPVVKA
jgi:hypothetical protein